MNNITWFLEEGLFEEENLSEEILKQGFNLKTQKYMPFTDGKEYSNLFSSEECVIFHGSLALGQKLIRNTNCNVYCTLQNYECTFYYPRFGDLLLNQNYIMLPFGDLKRRKQFLFDTLGNNDCLFVRPSSGFKLFTGQIVEYSRWEQDIDLFNSANIYPEKIVVVAEPQNLIEEWRLIVVDDKVITGSKYLIGKKQVKTLVTEDILEYGQKVVDRIFYSPDLVWCLDVCRKIDGSLAVLEVGGFSCAGLYGSDKSLIVKEISEKTHKDWLENYG